MTLGDILNLNDFHNLTAPDLQSETTLLSIILTNIYCKEIYHFLYLEQTVKLIIL